MKKWILPIIMALFLIPIVYSLTDCSGIMNPGKVPCLVINSWQYENPCNTYTVKIFYSNETPNLLDTRTMGDYGTVTSRCNITFNYTTLGSYLFNFSSGDSASIIIEGEDEMASLSVMLFIGGITFFLIFMGLKFDFSRSPVANLIFKRVLIALGMFLLSLDTTILATIADNAGLGVTTELFRYLWMVNWSIYLFLLWLFWTTTVNVLRLWRKTSEEKRMGLGEDEGYL